MRVAVLILCASLAVLTSGQAFTPKAALLIIDIQDCFLAGGSLEVKNGDDVIPVINSIRANYGDKFDLVVLSQDWHCPRHVSFASTNPVYGVFDTVNLVYTKTGQLCLNGSVTAANYPGAIDCSSLQTVTMPQALWPDHCVQDVNTGPTSSAVSRQLTQLPTDVIIKKGSNCDVDSYSAFFDVIQTSQTELDQRLRDAGINMVFVTGLAIDYCVKFTALDAKKLGYETYVVKDASRGVNPDPTAAIQELTSHGVQIITSNEIGYILESTLDPII